MKERITKRPVIRKTDPVRPYKLETDIFDKTMEIQLRQRDEKGTLHPMTFFSKQFQETEFNYLIYNKELMIIVKTMEKWRVYLVETLFPIQIFSNYKNLIYLKTVRQFSEQYAKWLIILLKFDFRINYRKRLQNDKADAFSHRRNHIIDDEFDKRTILRQKREQFIIAVIYKM